MSPSNIWGAHSLLPMSTIPPPKQKLRARLSAVGSDAAGQRRYEKQTFLDGYSSTVQGLLDWFEVDLGFTELLFIQIHLCVMCV